MKTNTVNISFQKKLLEDLDQLAHEEDRTRSELIREAARVYIEKKSRWKEIFKWGARQAKALDLKEKDIHTMIKNHRLQNKKSNARIRSVQ